MHKKTCYLKCTFTYISLIGMILTFNANSAPLNDTGISQFTDEKQSTETEPGTHPQQDASIGRDAAAAAGVLRKIGGGSKGFDFTKIANNGNALPETAQLGEHATDWACTKDNVTGLLWEVKVDDETHFRHKDWRYSWFNTDNNTNGGTHGRASQGFCLREVNGVNCDTEKYIAQVNANNLCNYKDWRLPTIGELRSLVNYGMKTEKIESAFFNNSVSQRYWTRSIYAFGNGLAWTLEFMNAEERKLDIEGNNLRVLLVRGN